MDDFFTENQLDQIQRAVRKALNTPRADLSPMGYPGQVMLELAPIQYKPIIGEVVCNGEPTSQYWMWSSGNILASWPRVRPLAPSEVPALKIAMNWLETSTPPVRRDIILEKINKLLNVKTF